MLGVRAKLPELAEALAGAEAAGADKDRLGLTCHSFPSHLMKKEYLENTKFNKEKLRPKIETSWTLDRLLHI